MKRLFLTLALFLITATAWSQPTDAGTGIVPSAAVDSEGERSRIQAERAREAARYQSDEAACYARFAVSDCLRKARAQRREVLGKLRQQELALNDAERKRKTQEQLERIKEKSSAQQMEEEAARRREAREARQEREERARQKTAASGPATPGRVGAKKTIEPGRSKEALAEEQKQYNDKLKEAQEHRASREKSNSEKSGTSSKPLPVEP
ncbi:hypothetical protein [Rhodoferax ferrireducens]|uniref:hypothetical protein n=1 Tax=Rhodoferax ferrireducens TaxID=192843 RepID=UPI000E0DFD7C|nr:hypothetical protein [Rhodoferax ferrireducens]